MWETLSAKTGNMGKSDPKPTGNSDLLARKMWKIWGNPINSEIYSNWGKSCESCEIFIRSHPSVSKSWRSALPWEYTCGILRVCLKVYWIPQIASGENDDKPSSTLVNQTINPLQ